MFIMLMFCFAEAIVMSSVVKEVYSDPDPPLPSEELLERYYDLVNELW